MNFQQLLLIFKARHKTVLFVMLGTVAFVLLLSFVLPPTYKATSSVVVNVNAPDPVAGTMMSSSIGTGYMSTQSDIITSDSVAIRAIKLLKLDESPEVKKQWFDATDGKGTVDVWLASILKNKLDVKSAPDSNVLNIVFSAESPDFAAAVSNAFAQAYMQASLDLQVEPAKQYSRWFDERQKVLRANLEAAQSKLSDYQQKTGIVMADQNQDIDNSKIAQLSGQLVTAQTQTADSQSRELHKGAGNTMADVLQSPVIQSIKAQIVQLEAKRQDLGIGKNHPQYQSIQSEIDTLKQKMDAETEVILKGIATTNQVNRQRERELKLSISQQKVTAFENNKQRDQLSVLQNEVMAAQKAYGAISDRIAQVNLQSFANQTNVSMLSPATPPLKPWFPNMFLNVIASVFLGIVFGLATAFIREARDRRVRTLDDLISIGLPVLAQFRLPKPKKRFLIFARSS